MFVTCGLCLPSNAESERCALTLSQKAESECCVPGLRLQVYQAQNRIATWQEFLDEIKRVQMPARPAHMDVEAAAEVESDEEQVQ